MCKGVYVKKRNKIMIRDSLEDFRGVFFITKEDIYKKYKN
jgi:hypothetical protein